MLGEPKDQQGNIYSNDIKNIHICKKNDVDIIQHINQTSKDWDLQNE